jgi:hypothetical protein
MRIWIKCSQFASLRKFKSGFPSQSVFMFKSESPIIFSTIKVDHLPYNLFVMLILLDIVQLVLYFKRLIVPLS